ncbi:MAG: hypothetical protein ACLFQX_08155 [Candidatus Kapaibacterium sp.]
MLLFDHLLGPALGLQTISWLAACGATAFGYIIVMSFNSCRKHCPAKKSATNMSKRQKHDKSDMPDKNSDRTGKKIPPDKIISKKYIHLN